jgi:hypothetical protein
MILKVRVGQEEQQFHLHFHREESESDESRKAKNLPPLRWSFVTTCAVHTGPCVPSAGEQKYCTVGIVGTSKCSKLDQCVRATGAKLALARAIRGLSEDIRKQIWEAYWQRTRRPKERSDKFRRRVGLVPAGSCTVGMVPPSATTISPGVDHAWPSA